MFIFLVIVNQKKINFKLLRSSSLSFQHCFSLYNLFRDDNFSTFKLFDFNFKLFMQ